MVKRTKDMRTWVVDMVSPVPSKPFAAGVPHLKLDDMGTCAVCGSTRLVNELREFGGVCSECAEL